MFKGIIAYFVSIFHNPTAEEDYQRGREHAEKVLALDSSKESVDQLWAYSKMDRCFGGDGHFDRGIANVLAEHGYQDPEVPAWG